MSFHNKYLTFDFKVFDMLRKLTKLTCLLWRSPLIVIIYLLSFLIFIIIIYYNSIFYNKDT